MPGGGFPQLFKPRDLPPCLAVFIKRSYEEGVGGRLCQETDCGNTWSPNVILPREFLRFYVTDTYALVHTKSQSSAVSSVKRSGGGTELVVSKVVLGPSDVKLMFIKADNLLVLILEKIPGSSGALGRNSAGFQC